MENVMKRLVLAVGISMASFSALAQSAFEGFYAGFNTGGSYGQFKTNTTTSFLPSAYSVANGTYWANTTNPGNVSASGSGTQTSTQPLGGLLVGYNKHFSGIGIVGIEADFSYIGLNSSQTKATEYPAFPGYAPQSKVSVRADTLGTLRLKYGFSVEKNTMAYITAGGAYTNISSDLSFSDGVVSLTNNQTKAQFGYALGAGGEYMFSKKLSLKLEYLYVSFGNITNTSRNLSGDGNSFPNQLFTTSTNLNISTLRVGLNKYF